MADTCIVTGVVSRLDGTLVAESQVVATIDLTQDDKSGQLVGNVGVTEDPVETFTELDGTFAIVLLCGARVRLEIPAINLRKFITVPNLPTVDFSVLI